MDELKVGDEGSILNVGSEDLDDVVEGVVDAPETSVVEAEQPEVKKQPIWLQVPQIVPSKNPRFNRRDFTGKDGTALSALQMPPGTSVIDMDGNEVDVSFYSLTTRAHAVRDSFAHADTCFAIAVPEMSSEGKPWVIRLTKTEGHRDTDGKFVADTVQRVDVDAKYLANVLEVRAAEYDKVKPTYIHIPAVDKNGKPFVRETKNPELVVCKLPKGVEVNIDGANVDLSYHTFFSKASCVHEDLAHPGFIKVFVPEQNGSGDAWTIKCSKDTFVKGDDGKFITDEAGHYVKDEAACTEFTVTGADLSAATTKVCANMRNAAEHFAKKEEKTDAEVTDKFAAAKAAAATQSAPTKTAPAKEAR